jgi:hypothetical protein
MRRKIILLIHVLFILGLVSCTKYYYSPVTCLDVSPETIHKKVKIEPFKDASSVLDRIAPLGGFTLISEENSETVISCLITNTIKIDFNNNAVFDEIVDSIVDYDYIMKGEIKKIYGKSGFTIFGGISYITIYGVLTWFTGLPIHKNITAVEFSISMFNKTGDSVGTYTGFYSEKQLYNLYHRKGPQLERQMNITLSIAVSQIRDQLLRDIQKYK